MYVLSYLKQGLGNKIFHFATSLYFYLELRKKNKSFDKLYIAEARSKHQADASKEKFNLLFPNIAKYEWIEFITFRQFDEMKKTCVIIEQNKMKKIPTGNSLNQNIMFDPNYNFSNVPFLAYNKLLKNMLTFEPSLEYDYDFDNDIFLHMRYGDKLRINIERKKTNFVVLKPEYYFEGLLMLRKKAVRNVYIFTDSKEIIERVYMPEFKKMKEFNFIISNEPYWNVFYLAMKFRSVITSESSLIYPGLLLNDNYDKVIAFPYSIMAPEFMKTELSDWPNKIPDKILMYKGILLRTMRVFKKDFILLDNKNYILTKDFFK